MKAVDYLEMPDRVETEVYVTMDAPERKLYNKFGRERVLETLNEEDNTTGAIVGVNAAAVGNKLLQLANGFACDDEKKPILFHEKKLEALEELVEAAGDRNLLVYYEFIADKDRILQRFPQARMLKGPEEVRDWNAGKIKMLVAHPASAGHGLNLQEGGNTVVWFGLPWNLEHYQQANARVYRQGQKNTVYIYHILTRDTHDIDVLTALKKKDLSQKDLLEALKARIEKWKTDSAE
jgi:SNF2 family DNA or RNA helicase